jgi:deoxyribodipyrimidine photolyase-related protein
VSVQLVLEFYNKNEDKLEKTRIGMMYNVWNKMKPESKVALLEQAIII